LSSTSPRVVAEPSRIAGPRGLDHLGYEHGADQETRARGERLLRLAAGEHRTRTYDRATTRERVVERELLDDLERVRDRQRDLHEPHACFAQRPRRLARDLRASRPDHGDEPILSKYPDQITAQSERPLGNGHISKGWYVLTRR